MISEAPRAWWKAIVKPILYIALLAGVIMVLARIKHDEEAGPPLLPQIPEWNSVSSMAVVQQALANDDGRALRPVFRKGPRGMFNPAAVTFLAQDRTQHVLGVLIEGGFDPNGKSRDGSPILTAITHAQFEALKVLLKHGANPNLCPQASPTALCDAIGRNAPVEIVKLLIDHGANVDAPSLIPGFFGGTPLEVACRVGDAKIVELLLEKGHPKEEVLSRSLGIACRVGTTATTKLLLERGALPNGPWGNSGSPLAWSIRRNIPELAKLLLEHGADPNVEMEIRNSGFKFVNVPVLYVAATSGNGEIVRLLLAHGADKTMPVPGGQSLAAAVAPYERAGK